MPHRMQEEVAAVPATAAAFAGPVAPRERRWSSSSKEELEDMATQKLHAAQRSAQSIKRRVACSLRALAGLLAFGSAWPFFYFAAPGISGTGPYAISGFAFLLIPVPTALCMILLSILPNDEKMSRIFSIHPVIAGFIVPNTFFVLSAVRNGSMHCPVCALGSSATPAAART